MKSSTTAIATSSSGHTLLDLAPSGHPLFTLLDIPHIQKPIFHDCNDRNCQPSSIMMPLSVVGTPFHSFLLLWQKTLNGYFFKNLLTLTFFLFYHSYISGFNFGAIFKEKGMASIEVVIWNE